MAIFPNRLKYLRESLNVSQLDLSKKLLMSNVTLSQYENGVRKPDLDTLVRIAEFYNVSTDYLLGRTNNPTETLDSSDTNIEEETVPSEQSNIRIVELDRNVVRIPVVGRIPAGTPVEAIEDILDYEEIPADWTRGDSKYIGLVVEGDSMYPKYIEGDIVIIRLQQDCESGQDCACYVNGYDATLKTVKKGDGKITLTPVNTAYSPRTYVHPGEVEILGVVKELRRKF